MDSIVKILQKYDPDKAEDLAKWNKLRHCKEDLELFLTFNIAEILYVNEKNKVITTLCTSNTVLINVIKTKSKKGKKSVKLIESDGIHTRNMDSIDTWDIVHKHTITIPLKSWQIINFKTISISNILQLDELINKILK